ncbi:hypothetical protein L2E82_27494 [Cichorium intybus]|uniref:Uncharacterized protein n=1 Tax=Cichorium intybus TaxID=13427 RepID=A0ACB9CT94_CICIN|nr:hypothetical protein L2E82_27494 [Cichorium intybus]
MIRRKDESEPGTETTGEKQRENREVGKWMLAVGEDLNPSIVPWLFQRCRDDGCVSSSTGVWVSPEPWLPPVSDRGACNDRSKKRGLSDELQIEKAMTTKISKSYMKGFYYNMLDIVSLEFSKIFSSLKNTRNAR